MSIYVNGVYDDRLDGTHGCISETACHNSEIFAFLESLWNWAHVQLEHPNLAKWID